MSRRETTLELPFFDVSPSARQEEHEAIASPGAAAPPAAAPRGRPEPPSASRPAPPVAAPVIERPREAVAAPVIERPREAEILSVAELDRRLRRIVENAGEVRVGGEVTNVKAVASGHVYFTLKDEDDDASIDAVMYRTAPVRAKRLLTNGARVVVRGRATVYVARGRLQLVADDVTLAGRGALLEALEKLKKKLAAEGLFAAERKRPLPIEPRVIGVVTSGDGAVIHDIVTVAFRRGGARILLARAPVQGAGAAPRMARALALLQRVPEVEAIIVGRGGGSADDLAVFNDEELVREVARSRVPIVSAVGHETDVTLIDLASDARAATPSQAAEMLIPDALARARVVEQLASRIKRALRHHLEAARARSDATELRLRQSLRVLDERQQELDDLTARLRTHGVTHLAERRAEVARLSSRLSARHPRADLEAKRGALGPLSVRLSAAMERRLSQSRRTVASDAGRLSALSPLAVLARGYAIAEGPGGRAVRDATELSVGDAVRIRVHRGAVAAVTVAIEAPEEDEAAP